jgi:hypothetical protein
MTLATLNKTDAVAKPIYEQPPIPTAGTLWTADKLHCAVVPRSALFHIAERLQTAGIEVPFDAQPGTGARIRRVALLTNVLHRRSMFPAHDAEKRAALAAHRTQMAPPSSHAIAPGGEIIGCESFQRVAGPGPTPET